MKKIYLFVFIVVATVTAYGQITITNNDFVPLHSKLIIGNDSLPDASIVPGEAGANKTWDFTAITAHSTDTMLTVPPGQTPLAELFPESNYAAWQPDDSLYIYFNRNDDKVQLIGIGFNAFDAMLPYMKYTPPETLLDFPVNYGDNYSQTYFTINTVVNPEPGIGIDSICFKNTIMDETTVDAYGTLSTPMGTFETLRTKDVQISYDTVWALVFGNWIPYSATVDTSVNYSWWTNNSDVGFMLFSIDMDETGTQTESASYLISSIQAVSENQIASAKVYPNPANDVLTMDFEKRLSGRLVIYNQNGQQTENTDITDARFVTLSVSDYSPGMYLYEITKSSGSVLYRGKFIKR